MFDGFTNGEEFIVHVFRGDKPLMLNYVFSSDDIDSTTSDNIYAKDSKIESVYQEKLEAGLDGDLEIKFEKIELWENMDIELSIAAKANEQILDTQKLTLPDFFDESLALINPIFYCKLKSHNCAELKTQIDLFFDNLKEILLEKFPALENYIAQQSCTVAVSQYTDEIIIATDLTTQPLIHPQLSILLVRFFHPPNPKGIRGYNQLPEYFMQAAVQIGNRL